MGNQLTMTKAFLQIKAKKKWKTASLHVSINFIKHYKKVSVLKILLKSVS